MFTLYVMVPFSMSIPLKKYCWAKLWKRITTINDMVSILSSWEKMNCLNLVKHNRIQIVQAWLTAEWSKILSYWEKSSQFFMIAHDLKSWIFEEVAEHFFLWIIQYILSWVQVRMSQQCWQFYTPKYIVLAPHNIVFHITPPWETQAKRHVWNSQTGWADCCFGVTLT